MTKQDKLTDGENWYPKKNKKPFIITGCLLLIPVIYFLLRAYKDNLIDIYDTICHFILLEVDPLFYWAIIYFSLLAIVFILWRRASINAKKTK